MYPLYDNIQRMKLITASKILSVSVTQQSTTVAQDPVNFHSQHHIISSIWLKFCFSAKISYCSVCLTNMCTMLRNSG